MIRVILQGRTGNNLFQYAAGRALALRHNTDLILDGAWADRRHARQFEHLTRLPLAARYERRHTLAKRLFKKVAGRGPETFHRGPVIFDPSDGSVPDLGEGADHTLLIGFFQTPNHFTGIEGALRSEIDLSCLSLPDESRRFEDRLRSTTTVSIHVRRGDYLKIGPTQCLGEDYHARAIHWFQERHENLRFCVFSDDIPWCRTRFQGPEFNFCDLPASSSDPLHDLRLMAACHHHIIVNSSYSWWGAWVNPSFDKLVVAPKWWMKGMPSEKVTPENWLLLA